ncbi:ataxin-7-like protein 3 isoform X2 [Dysidea avara]|uniref:ataxin-7-like protein 3 isoform X2 n=1 Tax=Dysidea avara TaxID=196820 RepID=UPI0033250EA0
MSTCISYTKFVHIMLQLVKKLHVFLAHIKNNNLLRVKTLKMELFFNDMVEEIALEVYFELHRAVKLGYFEYCYPEETAFENHAIVEDKSLDVFGNTLQDVKKFVECTCPKCERVLGTSKFAPHLEKCLGMGRNSSRRVNNKKPNIVDSEDDDDDNEGEEWVFPVPEKKILYCVGNSKSKSKKEMKLPDRPSSSLLVKSAKSTERSISPANSESSSSTTATTSKPANVVYTVDYFKSLSSDQKRATLQEMCGVISERTKRLCTRSMNCPQHTEEQKRRVRMTLMDSSNDVEPPSKKSKLDNSSHSLSQDELDMGDSGDKRRSWSPRNGGQPSGKGKKSGSKKSRPHHDLAKTLSSSKKSKSKKQPANKRPISKAYTDMPIF